MVLGFLLACLLPFRKQFHRHAAIWTHRFSPEWWHLLLLFSGVAAWLGFFTSRHVEYSRDLWWQFSYESDTPRLLRAMVGTAGVLMVAGTFTWLGAPVALAIGAIGTVSVIKAVYIDRRELTCACVGGASNVPLGFVSLTESLMMVAMGSWMALGMPGLM